MQPPATYPGWKKFKEQLRELSKGVKSDKIPLRHPEFGDPPVMREQLVDALLRKAAAVPADQKCNCAPTKDDLLRALTQPQGRYYDWGPWSGRWRGTWWKPGGRTLRLTADWLDPKEKSTEHTARDAESMAGVRPGGTKCRKQDVIFRGEDGESVDRRGWNVSDEKRGYVWGWDPKDFGDEWQKAVNIGFPFRSGDCHCIIWLTISNAYLECLSADGTCYSIVALDGHGALTKAGPPQKAN